MGIPTLDNKSPGKRQVQRYRPSGALNNNLGDDDTPSPIKFLLLKNCVMDKRLNVVLRRPGASTETIASSLGVPLGVGEYTIGVSGAIPVNRTLLFNFAGNNFYANSANVYSSISKSSLTAFSTSRQCQMAKLGANMFIAGGLPAKWGGPGKTIDRVGIPAPQNQVNITSSNTGTGITLTSGTTYIHTFYDSATGLESDWSPPVFASGPVANHAIVVAIPAYTTLNFDKVRLYRYLDGGSIPYLVTTLNLGVLTYTDTTPDAQLTLKADTRYNKAVPPSNAYLIAKYAQCIWYVDALNPYKLVFSKPYTGADTDLEYFPINNYVISNEPITALYVVPGKMLVFHPRGISYVSGYSTDDFVFQPYIPGSGTVFPNSISTNGAEIFWVAEQGAVTMPINGGQVSQVSREIDLDLQPLLAGGYNSAIYISTAWNPSLRQFVLMINAQSSTNAQWEVVGTGDTSSANAGWKIAPAGVDDYWSDVANPNATNQMRVKIWGYSPELSQAGQSNWWHEYTFSIVPDDNASTTYPTFLFHPQPSNDTSDPQQDKTFMGYWDGTQGKVATLFRRDSNTDFGSPFTATYITERLCPGNTDGGFKFFQNFGVQNSYSDMSADGNGTFAYLIDFDDPQIRSYASSLIAIGDSGRDLKRLPTMQARHIHLVGTDTSQSQSKILLGEFFIHHRERLRRGGR